MTTATDPLREQLARVLDWQEAHVGFSKTIEGIPADKRAAHAEGFEHSPWQLLEHLRIALRDLVDFATNPQYAHAMKWPDDYWPKSNGPTVSPVSETTLPKCRRLRVMGRSTCWRRCRAARKRRPISARFC